MVASSKFGLFLVLALLSLVQVRCMARGKHPVVQRRVLAVGNDKNEKDKNNDKNTGKEQENKDDKVDGKKEEEDEETPAPTFKPTVKPTSKPSVLPTVSPTPSPTKKPTEAPAGTGSDLVGAEVSPTPSPVASVTVAPSSSTTSNLLSPTGTSTDDRTRRLFPFSMKVGGMYTTEDIDQTMELYLFGAMSTAFENVEWVLLDTTISSETNRRILSSETVQMNGMVAFLKTAESIPSLEAVHEVQLNSLKAIQDLIDFASSLSGLEIEAIRVDDMTITKNGVSGEDINQPKQPGEEDDGNSIVFLLLVGGFVLFGFIAYAEHNKVKQRMKMPVSKNPKAAFSGDFIRSQKEQEKERVEKHTLKNLTLETNSESNSVPSGETKQSGLPIPIDWNKVFSLTQRTVEEVPSSDIPEVLSTSDDTDSDGREASYIPEGLLGHKKTEPRGMLSDLEEAHLGPMLGATRPQSVMDSGSETESLEEADYIQDADYIPDSLRLSPMPAGEGYMEGRDITVDLADFDNHSDL